MLFVMKGLIVWNLANNSAWLEKVWGQIWVQLVSNRTPWQREKKKCRKYVSSLTYIFPKELLKNFVKEFQKKFPNKILKEMFRTYLSKKMLKEFPTKLQLEFPKQFPKEISKEIVEEIVEKFNSLRNSETKWISEGITRIIDKDFTKRMVIKYTQEFQKKLPSIFSNERPIEISKECVFWISCVVMNQFQIF